MADLYSQEDYQNLWDITGQVADLLDLYKQADETCRILIEQSLSSGNIGTARYRRQRLAAIRQFLSDTQDKAIPIATDLARTAYAGSAANAAAKIGAIAPDFGGGIHREALEILADNLTAGLNGAAETVGRQIDDLFRRAGLNAAASTVLLGASLAEGTNALTAGLRAANVTAFIDSAGREWQLSRYAEMVVRTNTADAIVRGNVNVAVENGYDLVEVLVIEDERLCEICGPYEGNVYSLAGATEGYEQLDELPPFHPNCRCDLNILTEAPPPEPQPFDYSEGLDLPSVQDFLKNYAKLADQGPAIVETKHLFGKILKDRRFDSKPTILDGAKFDAFKGKRFSPTDPWDSRGELYRGVSNAGDVTAADMIDDFREGQLFIGDGTIGQGTYSSPQFLIADAYRGMSDETGGIITMKLAPDAKVISLRDANARRELAYMQLRNDYAEEFRAIDENFAADIFTDAERARLQKAATDAFDSQAALIREPTQWALLNGYDAVWDDSYPQMVILNRGKVIIRKTNRQ